MTQVPEAGGTGLSPQREALLRMYARLDPDLRHALEPLGLVLPDGPDPLDELVAASSTPPPDRPRVHRLQLVQAAMALARHQDAAQLRTDDRITRVAQNLIAGQGALGTAQHVVDALHRAAPEEPPLRWRRFVELAGRSSLHAELKVVLDSDCEAGFRAVHGEVASRVSTDLVVRSDAPLDRLALALAPQNWPHCNDFFCDLVRSPDLDDRAAGCTGGDLAPDTDYWRGVFEERVGSCPGGWFPDTFLVFTWERSPSQLILRYELAPPRHGDRTVLTVDQGYVQVNRVGDRYHVSTLKYLLFNDAAVGGGGQVLGQWACELGWLDYSLSQFTTCLDSLTGTVDVVQRPAAGPDEAVQRALDRCEAHLRDTAQEVDAQLRDALARLRAGRYGADDWVADWTRAGLLGIRASARSVQDQVLLGRRALELARQLGGSDGR